MNHLRPKVIKKSDMMNGAHQRTGPLGGEFMAWQKREGKKFLLYGENEDIYVPLLHI